MFFVPDSIAYSLGVRLTMMKIDNRKMSYFTIFYGTVVF